MTDTFTDEQHQFRDVVARFCREQSPISAVRNAVDSELGFDRGVWKNLCQQVGLVAIHVPEERGGGGFGSVELGIVMEEFGRHLLPAPFFSTSVLSSTVIATVESAERRDELMKPLVMGERLATVALSPEHGWPLCRVDLSEGRASGTLRAVLDAAAADDLLLLMPDGGRAALLRIGLDEAGVAIHNRRTIDGTRRVADITLAAANAEVLGEVDSGTLQRVYDTAVVALSNEMVGGTQALLQSTLEYTQVRVQFGRPIGSFQALKHRLADLHVDVELAKVAAWQASIALATDDQPSLHASLAKFTTSDAYVTAALEAIQLRGGIGFTWENDTHLWYRRAKSSEVFLGTPAFHRNRMVEGMSV